MTTARAPRRGRLAGFVLACAALDCGARGPAGDEPEAAPEGRPPHVASPSCPLKTPADWQRFVTLATEGESWVSTCSDLLDCDERLGGFAAFVRKDVLGMLDACAEDVRGNPPIAACSARLRRYAPAWLRQHEAGTYGFDLPNTAYFAAQEAPGMPPGMMTPPQELVAALPSRLAVESAAASAGYPFLVHDSCLGGHRLFVLVPDPAGRFDQWLLFDVSGDSAQIKSPNFMSFLAVQKQDGQGHALPRVRVHFRDYVVKAASPSWTVELPAESNGKCYACHGSGPRQLLPFAGAATRSAAVKGEPGFGGPPGLDAGIDRLRALNERIAGYGLADWADSLNPADHGPPLGKPLGCTACHDGVARGPITVSTSEGMLHQKVLGQLSMRSFTGSEPVPDTAAMELLSREASGLSQAEAAQLAEARAAHQADYDALMASRYPAWRAWALETRCE